MSSPTKKMHVRANRERHFTDLERIYSYSSVKYIPGFFENRVSKDKDSFYYLAIKNSKNKLPGSCFHS